MVASMRLAFVASSTALFHPRSLEERPLGGTETGIIRLSEHLARRGHEVFIFTKNPKVYEGNPTYRPLESLEGSGAYDALISIRDWIPLFYQVNAKKRFFWTGDSYDQFPNFGLGDQRVVQRIDGLLAVSAWQAGELCRRSGFPIEKSFLLKNGIELSAFEGAEKRNPFRLIYSSTPYRGLEHIPLLFGTLKKIYPELEIHLFSGFQVYDQNTPPAFEALLEALQKMPGVHLHGNCLQAQLAREMMKSSILFYPCHFEETSCITAMEAMAAGCVPLTTRLGALPETIGDAGVLVEGPIQDAKSKEAFVKAAHELLQSPPLWQEYSDRAKKRASEMSWSQVAERFEGIVQGVL